MSTAEKHTFNHVLDCRQSRTAHVSRMTSRLQMRCMSMTTAITPGGWLMSTVEAGSMLVPQAII